MQITAPPPHPLNYQQQGGRPPYATPNPLPRRPRRPLSKRFPTDSFTSPSGHGRAVRADRCNGEARICRYLVCARQNSPSSASSSQTSPASASAPPKRSSGSANVQSSASSSRRRRSLRPIHTVEARLLRKRRRVGSTYVALRRDLPGASESGSSVQSAENNLSIR